VINKAASTGEKELWSHRYEQLRQQCSAKDVGLSLDCWGLSLLRRQGVVGWMRAWRDPVACAQEAPGTTEPFAIDQVTSSRREVTLLLANMALSHADGPPA